jgi:hypothetical protein
MKNLIKKIIRESIEESLFYKGRNVPDMAGRIGRDNKKDNYIGRGELNVRKELIKLVIQFIKDNYPNDLERYKGNFMYKLNNSIFRLSDDDIINFVGNSNFIDKIGDPANLYKSNYLGYAFKEGIDYQIASQDDNFVFLIDEKSNNFCFHKQNVEPHYWLDVYFK